MSFFFEGRTSPSPYINMVWRGRAGSDYAPTCPADGHWNLLFLKQNGRVRVSVEGPLTQAKSKTQAEGTEWLVVTFQSGTFLPSLSIKDLVDTDVVLPLATNHSFWLHSSSWQFPDYENVETFIDRLIHDGVLDSDPLVNAVMQNQAQESSARTVRRHFLQTTGLTPNTLAQIERAQKAAALLEQGVPLLDVVYQTGYADQPHMTRALKHFIGQTPAQIVRESKARDLAYESNSIYYSSSDPRDSASG